MRSKVGRPAVGVLLAALGLALLAPQSAQAQRRCKICNSYVDWCSQTQQHYDRWQCLSDPNGAACSTTFHSGRDGCTSDCSEGGDCSQAAVLSRGSDHWAWVSRGPRQAPACLTTGVNKPAKNRVTAHQP
jgi:hypothetical protein